MRCRHNAAPTFMPRVIITDDPVEAIEGRWNLQILLRLNDGEHRFSDLKTALARISANVLTERIRALEGAGLVERRYLPPPAASHVYALTELGAGLKPALDAIGKWQVAVRRTCTRTVRND